jgi:membrane protein DedA with SNARE-associated domain/membrane-associated phospholipid phosphatase
MEELIKDFAHSLGGWAYLLVSFMATAETAAFLGFIAPGEFTIILGGVLAGEGTLSIALLIGIVWASIVIGDSIGFTLGRKLGRSFLIRHGPRVRLTEERLRRVEDYFKRHGGKTIFFGRWIGFVRPLMPFTAGTSGMPYKRFLPYDVLSAGLFGSTFCLLGYFFWHSFDQIASIAGRSALAFGILVGLVIGVVLAFKRLRDPQQRRRLGAFFERLGRRPLVRPVAVVVVGLWRALLRPVWHRVIAPTGRLLSPPARFLGQRLTPGGLGIEFTSLLAIAAVCSYIFILYTDLVSGDSSFVSWGDDTAIDVSRDIHSGALTSIAKVISVFGSWPLVTAIVVVGTGILVLRRHLLEAAVLVLGFGLTQAAIYITKAAVERARPPDQLIDAGGSSFPSGHAATSTTCVVLAVIAARALPQLTWRVALIVGSAALAALVGLSRVYLRVHYLSDVTSGWALSLAIFSLCGCAALVVSYLRDNERASGPQIAHSMSNPSDG